MPSILTRNKEGVLKVFNEVHKCPVFAIYEGNRQLTCCTEDSQKKRLQALTDFLEIMEQSGTTASFDLRCYEAANKNGKVNTADPYFAFLPFKVCDGDKAIEMQLQKTGTAPPATHAMINDLMDAKLKLIQMQFDHALEKKEAEILRLQQEIIDDDDDDDEDDRVGQILGTIGAVGEKHPWMQDLLKNFGNTVNNMLRGANTKWTAMTETPMAVNGVDTAPPPAADISLDDQLKWANQTLIASYRAKHGVHTDNTGKIVHGTEEQINAADTEYVHDMVKLAQVASTKPKTFNNAIEALREL